MAKNIILVAFTITVLICLLNLIDQACETEYQQQIKIGESYYKKLERHREAKF